MFTISIIAILLYLAAGALLCKWSANLKNAPLIEKIVCYLIYMIVGVPGLIFVIALDAYEQFKRKNHE